MIVAASSNDVIGVDGDLPWRLSADLKRFKSLTMGHHMIMGRKTFESLGRLLPGRISVVVTRNQNFRMDQVAPIQLGDELDPDSGNMRTGYKVAHSIEDAFAVCGDDPCPFVTGGAEIYRQGLSRVTEIQLTRVHLEVAGDTLLPAIDWERWDQVQAQRHRRDERNEADYSFQVFQRR